MGVTDRELLELAAKAADLEIVGEADRMVVDPGIREGGLVFRNERGGDSLWNPLADDGDALRLSMRLKIDIHHGDQYVEAIHSRNIATIGVVAEYFRTEEHRAEAARRVVVRAAAEIGKGK